MQNQSLLKSSQEEGLLSVLEISARVKRRVALHLFLIAFSPSPAAQKFWQELPRLCTTTLLCRRVCRLQIEFYTSKASVAGAQAYARYSAAVGSCVVAGLC